MSIASFDQTLEPTKIKIKSEYKKEEGKDTLKFTFSTPSVVFTAQVNATPPTATKPVAIRNALAARKAVDWFI
jgi:hypothetical protein